MTDGNTSQITNTHYSESFQYTENHLDFFPHAEGYVNVIDYSAFNYVYTYKDHLGNIRLKYTLDPDTNETAILEENHYYPYGLTHQGYNADHKFFFAINEIIELVEVTSIMDDKYKYKFNGMEWQDELDLNHYDFGARNYDAALGRWMNIDPLAEYQFTHSPYGFAFNNPVYYVDPDGMFPISNFNSLSVGSGSFGLLNNSNTLSNGGDDPPKDPEFPDTSGVQKLDEVVIVVKASEKDEDEGEGIGVWGNGIEDLGRKGRRTGDIDINDLPTLSRGKKTGNNLMDFLQWVIDLFTVDEKIDRKLPTPNESTMEKKEEPVDPPKEVILKSWYSWKDDGKPAHSHTDRYNSLEKAKSDSTKRVNNVINENKARKLDSIKMIY